jgi:MSHA pilin protein MshD
LIELIISIVIVATAVSAVLNVLSSNLGRSADAFITVQAGAIAEAYLEEIRLRPFTDPDGIDGETNRIDFDDLDDYDGLVDNGARDQFDAPIAGLNNYSVNVTVVASAALPGVPSADCRRIDVRVIQAPYVDFTLSSYRTQL